MRYEDAVETLSVGKENPSQGFMFWTHVVNVKGIVKNINDSSVKIEEISNNKFPGSQTFWTIDLNHLVAISRYVPSYHDGH